MNNNIITMTDGYKPSHWKQYPPGTTHVFSYFESRGGEFPQTTFFGLQYFLERYLTGSIVTSDKIAKAQRWFASYFGNTEIFNAAGWEHIVKAHGGKLPLEIRAVPEGTRVPTGNALMTIVNTDPATPWLTNYVETLLSQVWYPTTIATLSRAMKDEIVSFLELTGSPELIAFKLHDFGYRGVSSPETAALGGAAHLLNFMGSDTLAGMELLEDYYEGRDVAFSIPAAEHSTITSWGREREVDAFRNMLQQFPGGLVACVSDSFDIFAACRDLWGGTLKNDVLARDGVLVVRPDSGHPPDVVVRVLDALGNAFGSEKNAKGYRVLNPKVRVIQGDGIDLPMLRRVLEAMTVAGWSADNVAFGSGGGLLQKVNRDTQRFALKCSAVCRNGIWQDVSKDPVTDSGKRSKAGRLELVCEKGKFRTVRAGETLLSNELVPVFRDGVMLKRWGLSKVRALAAE